MYIKNALIYHYFNNINGSLFDAFEYYLCIKKFNKKMKLIILNCNNDSLVEIFKIFVNRYNLPIGFNTGILNIPLYEIIRYNFDKTLVLDYGTIEKTKGLISTKEMIIISDKNTYKQKYSYKEGCFKITYYGEMPFERMDKEYNIKLYFDIFKDPRYIKEGTYVNSPFSEDCSFMKNIDLPKPWIFKSTKNHLENMFEQFDNYLYFHANKWFDPHPRLLLECAFYDKELHYYNDPGILDGSYYRWVDLKKNGLRKRFLNENDEVVKEFI